MSVISAQSWVKLKVQKFRCKSLTLSWLTTHFRAEGVAYASKSDSQVCMRDVCMWNVHSTCQLVSCSAPLQCQRPCQAGWLHSSCTDDQMPRVLPLQSTWFSHRHTADSRWQHMPLWPSTPTTVSPTIHSSVMALCETSGSTRVFAARGKHLCCRPCHQITSAIRVFIRISDMECEPEPIVGAPSLCSLNIPSPPLFPPITHASPPLPWK